MVEECWSCRSLRGEGRISPGCPVFDGRYWVLEHAYPSGLSGWLVLVLKRHAAAAHELTSEEFDELGLLLEPTVRTIRDAFDTEKEYVLLLAEGEHFRHVHVHVIPVGSEMPKDLRGASVFGWLKMEPQPPRVIEEVCKDLSRRFALTAGDIPTRPDRVFHLVSVSDWDSRGGEYAPSSLAFDGFIHCATASQVLRVADSLFSGRDDLLLVTIDAAVLGERLVWEDCHEANERYPHLYGPIPDEAVVSILGSRGGRNTALLGRE